MKCWHTGPESGHLDDAAEAILAADFKIGHFLRAHIIPRSILDSTGEATEEDDDYDEEGEEADKEGEEDKENDPDYESKKPQNPAERKKQSHLLLLWKGWIFIIWQAHFKVFVVCLLVFVFTA